MVATSTTVSAEATHSPTKKKAPHSGGADLLTHAPVTAPVAAPAHMVSWASFVDKTAQTALLLIVVKLVAAWAIAAVWSVGMRSHFMWGFIPYAGLETTPRTFRSLAAWSTAIVAGIAVLWLAIHYLTRWRRPPERLWGAFVALPMAALLATLEWWRRFDGEHLIPGQTLGYVLLGLAVPMVLFFGFVETPNEWAQRETDQRT